MLKLILKDHVAMGSGEMAIVITGINYFLDYI